MMPRFPDLSLVELEALSAALYTATTVTPPVIHRDRVVKLREEVKEALALAEDEAAHGPPPERFSAEVRAMLEAEEGKAAELSEELGKIEAEMDQTKEETMYDTTSCNECGRDPRLCHCTYHRAPAAQPELTTTSLRLHLDELPPVTYVDDTEQHEERLRAEYQRHVEASGPNLVARIEALEANRRAGRDGAREAHKRFADLEDRATAQATWMVEHRERIEALEQKRADDLKGISALVDVVTTLETKVAALERQPRGLLRLTRRIAELTERASVDREWVGGLEGRINALDRLLVILRDRAITDRERLAALEATEPGDVDGVAERYRKWAEEQDETMASPEWVATEYVLVGAPDGLGTLRLIDGEWWPLAGCETEKNRYPALAEAQEAVEAALRENE